MREGGSWDEPLKVRGPNPLTFDGEAGVPGAVIDAPEIGNDATMRLKVATSSFGNRQRREHSGQIEIVLFAAGPWIDTVTGVPVLKNPTVPVVACGGLLESKRKLYNVPQRNTFAFWFSANVCELHVIAPDV